MQDEIFVERPQLIVLSRVIPDPINSDLRSFQHRLVEEVNDVKIRKMEDLQKAFAKDVKHHVIKLYSQGRPIVIDAAKVKAAEARIAQRYGIKSFQFIRTGGEK